MAEEYVGILNTADPTNATNAADIDDKIRVVKTACYNSFPSVTGAVTKTHTQINALPDVGDNETVSGNWEFSGTPTFQGRNFKGVLAASISPAGAVTAQSDGTTITATRTATGRYTVTHNLGTTSYGVFLTLQNVTAALRTIIGTKAPNTVDVVTINAFNDYGDFEFEILLVPY